MSKNKYIYIDDENDPSTEAIVDGLNDTGIIEVSYRQVEEFNSQISFFEKELNSFQGIILDLRLDENMGVGVRFTAPSLAQEIRTKSGAGLGIQEIPIILCSTDQKIKALYSREQSSHDLFDYEFLKGASPNWIKIASRLNSLAEGYRKIKEVDYNIENVFGRPMADIDARILGKFIDKELGFPVHEFSQHILKQLIRWPGPLIGFELLGAKLGLDIELSEDWEELLNEHLINCRYTGVFSEGWSRWWNDLLVNWFNSLTGKRLSTLKAEERVDMLKEKLGLTKLVAAKPLPKSVSTNYSTICEFYRKPIDPFEGFKVFGRKDPKPWQEHQYLSIEAVLERRGLNQGLKIHPSEMDRVELIKQSLRNT
ncbi:MAG: hypothetical protein AB3N18_05675 [Allomuricauda sp.]